MKSITLKTVFTLVLSGILVTSLLAQPPARRGSGPGYGLNENNQRGAHMEKLLPDLTEDQQAALEELKIERYKTMKDHKNLMRELNAKEHTIMSSNPIDEKAAQKIIDEKAELMKKHMNAKVEHQVALQEILTEEQYMKLEHLQKRKQLAQRKARNNRSGEFQGSRHSGRGGTYRY